MNEADTCRTYVLPKLKSAGWQDDYFTEQLVLTPGRIILIGDRHTRKVGLRMNAVFFLRQNTPIAARKAKIGYVHAGKGLWWMEINALRKLRSASGDASQVAPARWADVDAVNT